MLFRTAQHTLPEEAITVCCISLRLLRAVADVGAAGDKNEESETQG